MSLNPFREMPLREQLEKLLEETRVARVQATAQAAYWINQERFKLAEIERLNKELADLDPAAGVVLRVGPVEPPVLREVVVPHHTH